jgi:alkaline phosphatase D
MKVAFVSCFCRSVYGDQPVWDWIASQSPDFLVLLGDSIYLDINYGETHPRDMTDLEFANWIVQLYRETLTQPQFKALLGRMGKDRVFSTWDDHDFLWNDACGAFESKVPAQKDKVAISSRAQELFREALAKASIKDFPKDGLDARLWSGPATLSTPSVTLAPDVSLHLLDVRTHRTPLFAVPESKRAIVGAQQAATFEQRVAPTPATHVHLLASGSTLKDWKPYAQDWDWLKTLASQHRTLVLSGDIHRNNSYQCLSTGGLGLLEATSSGVAVKDAVVIGKRRRNFGMLDIRDSAIDVSLYADGKIEPDLSGQILRINWTWV